jgi:hypothetical protein
VGKLDAVVPIAYTLIGTAGVLLLHFSNEPGELASVCVAARLIQKSIQFDSDCTFWIRRSTGRLCADLIPSDFDLIPIWYHGRSSLEIWQVISLNVPNTEAMVIGSLTLEEFHMVCARDLARGCPRSFVTPVTVHLGAVLVSSGSSDPDYLNEIVSSSNIRIDSLHWRTFHRRDNNLGARGEVTEDGWTRYSYFI